MLFIRGTFIVLDGPDGGGKKTQQDLLVQRLRQEGYAVEIADFPQYNNWSAQFVERYLRGEFGEAGEVSSKEASLLYAVDRYAARQQLRQWLQEGKVVVSNRYVSANKGHQLGKIQDLREMLEYLQWVNDLEYNILKLPVPDLTILLHMRPSIGQRLVDQKAPREYTHGKKRDIHEKDIDHLANAERAFLFCLEHDRVENWKRIVCYEGDQPRPREIIQEEVYTLIKDLLLRQYPISK